MLFSLGLAALPWLAAAAGDDDIRSRKAADTPPVKGGYIVELETDVKLDISLGKRGHGASTSGQGSFFGLLEQLGIGYSTRQTYNTPDLFHGISLQLDDSVSDSITVDHLLGLPGVINVWPIRTYHPLDHDSPRRIRDLDAHKKRAKSERWEELELAAELESQLDGDLLGQIGGITKTERAAKSYPSIPPSKFKQDNFAPHVMTSVDQAHAAGILGEHVKVAVIDTGVDYKHPALGGCFGPGCKISFGYDVVGDGYSGYNEPHPDPDPYDPCGEHGTHVTGIVGADPNEFNFTGVAPYAQLGHYRVFGCVPPTVTQDDVMIKAMEMAYGAGANVITLSIGGTEGWTEDAASALANRLNELGTIVTIAAGNEGSEGMFFTASPAASDHTWSIGSVETTELPILRTAVATGGMKIPYYSLFKFNDEASKLPVYATSHNLSDQNDACNPFPASTPNLSNYLVVAQRGICFIDTKYENLAAAGARYVLLANNGNTPFYDDGLADGLVQAALTTTEAGQWLRERAINGTKTYVDFSDDSFMPVADPAGGLINGFSNYGPTFDMVSQPTMSAPGGNILSTFPLRLRGYGIISGTSMATPHVAGAAALYLSAREGRPTDSVEVRSIFLSTGTLLPVSATDKHPIPVDRQGGGMINITTALRTHTHVEPSQLNLNDTAHFAGTQTITITNIALTPQTYAVTHEPTLTALNYDQGDLLYPSTFPELTTDYASVVFDQKTITVLPLGEGTLVAKFSYPTGHTKRLPIYGGYVVLTSSTDKIRIPYHGAAAALHSFRIIDFTDAVQGYDVPAIVDSSNVTTGDVQTGPHVYHLSGQSFPTLVFRLLMGSANVTTDLVHGHTQFKPTLGDPYYLHPTNGTAPQPDQLYTDVHTIGNIPEMSLIYAPRTGVVAGDLTDYELTWSGNVTVDGESQPAADGKYRFLLRALKLNGNGDLEADWESWLSPIIHVERS